MTERLTYLDALKGIGICLVVAGHAIGGVNGAFPEAPSTLLDNIFYTIYTFHMPLFFFLSGLHITSRLGKGSDRFLRGLLKSIVAPYIIWSIIAIVILYYTSGVRNGTEDNMVHSLISIFWAPPAWLWFFYVLFVCHIIAVISRGSAPVMLLIGVLFYVAADHFGDYPKVIPYTLHFLIFYALGMYMGAGALLRPPLKRPLVTAVVSLVVFIASALFLKIKGYDYWSAQALPAAVSGTAFLFAICSASAAGKSKVLIILGNRSLPIYVMHVFFAAGVRIAWLKLGLPHNLEAIAIVAIGFGIAGPLVLYEVMLRLGVAGYFGLGGAQPKPAKPIMST
jgi:fucose 4-O-acetylase-like acetyltransferase